MAIRYRDPDTGQFVTYDEWLQKQEPDYSDEFDDWDDFADFDRFDEGEYEGEG